MSRLPERWADREIGNQKDKQTTRWAYKQSHTNRWADKQAGRQIDGQTGRQMNE